MPDYFAAFGTTMDRVTQWAGTLGVTLTPEEIDANGAKAPPPAQLSEEDRRDLEAMQREDEKAEQVGPEKDWSSVDLAQCQQGNFIKGGQFGSVDWIESNDPNAPKMVMKTPKTADARKELESEADFYAKVGDHPNIVKCLGMQQIPGVAEPVLVLEGIKGKDMHGMTDELKARYDNGEISHEEYWGTIQYTMVQMLKGMMALEQAGVVHNDIRQDNVMCDATTGEVKIADFGIATMQGAQAPQKFPSGYGTYAPDGQVSGVSDVNQDKFSVGAAAYELGERDKFRYGGQSSSNFNNFNDYKANPTPPDALTKGSPDDISNEINSKTGQRAKDPGKFAADTAYTDFINLMMNPDPSKRPSAAEAMKHPFLANAMLDNEAARAMIMKTLAPPEPRPEPMSKAVHGVAKSPAGQQQPQQQVDDPYNLGNVSNPPQQTGPQAPLFYADSPENRPPQQGTDPDADYNATANDSTQPQRQMRPPTTNANQDENYNATADDSTQPQRQGPQPTTNDPEYSVVENVPGQPAGNNPGTEGYGQARDVNDPTADPTHTPPPHNEESPYGTSRNVT